MHKQNAPGRMMEGQMIGSCFYPRQNLDKLKKHERDPETQNEAA